MTTATVTAATALKSVREIKNAPGRHWVGDGFPVQGMFGYGQGAQERSPFLMLDYAAPTSFSPNPDAHRRGVGTHPHRGFETVTIVYDGEVEHRDSTGAGGVIGAGDVQWMTAGAGILHAEFHSAAYSKRGGPFEMVQLWVNLPAKDKMTPAHYHGITADTIATVALADDAGQVRLVAGQLGQSKGAAETYTPMHVWDVRLNAGKAASLPQPEGWTTLLLVQDGEAIINGQSAHAGQLVTLSHDGGGLELQAAGKNVRLLLLAGEPIDEPVVGYGPFVMNSQAEIRQAIDDFNSGRFGQIAD